MPSQRKRIGFLPRAEVQQIIDQICEYNKLSQSKVTGILVDEALSSRGVLNNSQNDKSLINEMDNVNPLLITKDIFDNKLNNDKDKLNLDNSYITDEVQMINDYIEFKFFKNIMKRNKKNI